jgi:DNA invertase Pin-like site-specific DNA recombinase
MSMVMARSRAGIAIGWRPSTSGSLRASRSPTTARPARLQYGLTGRAAALGWPASRVMVIDEDLGRSAANAAERPGFARLVAEITMGHVGLVLGLEMSRLARAGRDWHQLTGAVLAGRGAAGRRGRGLRSELV